MNTARKGRRKEHQVRDLFRERGYLVVRAAGSLGPVDLVCFPRVCEKHRAMGCAECGTPIPMSGDRPGEPGNPDESQVVLVQVKPRTIYRSEREELMKLAKTLTGACRVEGWVVVDRKKPSRQFCYY